MLGIILWVKCLEEFCQYRAAISMQIHACGGKCNWPDNELMRHPILLQWGVEARLEGRDLICLFSFSPSERAKHKRILCFKRGVRSTLLLNGRDCMEMRSCLLLLLSRTARTKAAFFRKERGSKKPGHSCFVK